MRMRLLGAVTLVTVLASPGFGAGPMEPNPRDFVLSLLRSRVPTGVVLPRELLYGSPAVGQNEFAGANSPGQLNTALERFNSAHARFRASNEAGVVHLRENDLPGEITAVLERSASMVRETQVSILGAVFRHGVFAMAGYEPQSIIGSGADVRPTPECPLLAPVDVPDGPTTPTRLLDGVVRQVPGIAWIVTYGRKPDSSLDLRVGLICSDGKHLMISVNP